MLQHIPILSNYDQGNGVCRYLENDLCSIYEDRPPICNTEKMYLLYFKDEMAENEFIGINIISCIQIAEYFKEESIVGKMRWAHKKE